MGWQLPAAEGDRQLGTGRTQGGARWGSFCVPGGEARGCVWLEPGLLASVSGEVQLILGEGSLDPWWSGASAEAAFPDPGTTVDLRG